MTGIRVLIRCASLFALTALVLGGRNASFGQSLNPNPLQPSGVGSASDVDLSRGDLEGGGRIGRGLGGGGALDENPADTLLKEINGSNNGRRTGRNAFGNSRRRTSGYRGSTGKIELGAVRFDQRGAYEEAIYGSRRGSYTTTTRRRPAR
jgi:hypothetical protein